MEFTGSACKKYYKFNSTTDVKECEQLCRAETKSIDLHI